MMKIYRSIDIKERVITPIIREFLSIFQHVIQIPVNFIIIFLPAKGNPSRDKVPDIYNESN